MYKTNDPYHFQVTTTDSLTNVRKRHGWSQVSPKTVGDRLRTLRDRMGFTQEEMMRFINDQCRPHVHIDLRKYQRWEQGRSLKRFISVRNLVILSEAFHVPLQYLTGAQGVIPPLWDSGSPFVSPSERVAKKDSPEFGLQMYRIDATYQGEKRFYTVLAEDKEDAKLLFMDELPIGKITRVRIVPWKPGIVW